MCIYVLLVIPFGHKVIFVWVILFCGAFDLGKFLFLSYFSFHLFIRVEQLLNPYFCILSGNLGIITSTSDSIDFRISCTSRSSSKCTLHRPERKMRQTHFPFRTSRRQKEILVTQSVPIFFLFGVIYI